MLTEYYLSRIYLLRVTLVCIVCWYLSPTGLNSRLIRCDSVLAVVKCSDREQRPTRLQAGRDARHSDTLRTG